MNISAEDSDLLAELNELESRQSFLETEVDRKYKAPHQFTEKELDKMLKDGAKLKEDMRDVLARVYFRDVRQGVADFRRVLTFSFNALGFTPADMAAAEKEIRDTFGADAYSVEYISNNWHTADLKDKDTKTVIAIENDLKVALHLYEWLINRSVQPIPDLARALKRLRAQTNAFNKLLASPVKTLPIYPTASMMEAKQAQRVAKAAQAEKAAAAKAKAAQAAKAAKAAAAKAKATAAAKAKAKAAPKKKTVTKPAAKKAVKKPIKKVVKKAAKKASFLETEDAEAEATEETQDEEAETDAAVAFLEAQEADEFEPYF